MVFVLTVPHSKCSTKKIPTCYNYFKKSNQEQYFISLTSKEKMKVSYFLRSGMQSKRIPGFPSCHSPTVLSLDGSVTSSRVFRKCLHLY